jgi:lipid II:glycine glycyltransferase (peptidoglycan interpeptide bridge formation enzyme)
MTPQEWNSALDQLPNPNPLQSWEWGAFKGRWGWQPHHIQIEGVGMALVLQRRIPRSPFCILYVPKGAILDYANPEARHKMLTRLEKMARELRAIFIKIDPDVNLSTGLEPEVPDPLGQLLVTELEQRRWRFSDDQIQFKNTVEIDLTPSEDEILGNMKSKTRYNIRLAGRKEVVVRPATPADFPAILALYKETGERDGFTMRPDAYYLDAWEGLFNAGICQPLIAEYTPENSEPIPLGAVVLLKQGNRAIYWQGASTVQERNRMPNYLLQWEAIRWAKAHGCTVYDMWGAPEVFDESDGLWGVWRFKSGFNGTVVRHIGAWDFTPRPLLYWLYTTAVPQYLNWLRRR